MMKMILSLCYYLQFYIISTLLGMKIPTEDIIEEGSITTTKKHEFIHESHFNASYCIDAIKVQS